LYARRKREKSDGLTGRLGHVRRALLIKAVLIAIAGVCVIAWPEAFARYLLWAIAALFIVDGIAGVLSLSQRMDNLRDRVARDG
jgi:uncharacterized membrane protein HdeD (DUF308 family)